MKQKIAFLTAVIIIICSFAACGQTNKNDLNDKTEEQTSASTTEPTTVTTTEDVNTTFAENSTSTIYSALKRDSNTEYPHKLAEYKTYYDSTNKTRTTNIEASIKKLDNLCIPNEKVFSFNQNVGKRTVLAGYQEAKVVKDGEFVDGLGGGVCQVNSTIFETVLRANLKIVSRSCHSLEISYVPLGGDATVQWNTTDFQFKNDSGTDIKMTLKAKGGTLTCTVYGKDAVDIGKVSVKISKTGKEYVLKRYVNGSVNYTTYSKYQKPKTNN